MVPDNPIVVMEILFELNLLANASDDLTSSVKPLWHLTIDL